MKSLPPFMPRFKGPWTDEKGPRKTNLHIDGMDGPYRNSQPKLKEKKSNSQIIYQALRLWPEGRGISVVGEAAQVCTPLIKAILYSRPFLAHPSTHKFGKSCGKQSHCRKLTFFCWTLVHGKILTGENLEKRGIEGPFICPLCCENNETILQLFFECNYARTVWGMLTEPWFGRVEIPSNVQI